MADTQIPKIWENWYAYDPIKHQRLIFNRPLLRWAFLAIFYVSFYLALTTFLVVLIAIFYETLDQYIPTWPGGWEPTERYPYRGSLQMGNPGLGFRPIPYYESTLIRFEQGKPSTYKPYSDNIDAYLINYHEDLARGEHVIKCDVLNGNATLKEDLACEFDLQQTFGPNSPCIRERDFGYEVGQPCVLLKMNRLYGFVPLPYANIDELMEANDLRERPRFLAFENNKIGISCDGDTSADRENLLEINFQPNYGISPVFFPYRNQEGYRSPFVMAQFAKTTKRVVINITCQLWARNIINSHKTPGDGKKVKNHGSVHFELLRD